MSINLIPQDELTLNLLAEVLAKMYQHSLNSAKDTPVEATEPDTSASSADLEDRRLGHTATERALTQVEMA